MKIIELPSLGTTQPTMFSHSGMNNKQIRKIQRKGWNYKKFKFIRAYVKKQDALAVQLERHSGL